MGFAWATITWSCVCRRRRADSKILLPRGLEGCMGELTPTAAFATLYAYKLGSMYAYSSIALVYVVYDCYTINSTIRMSQTIKLITIGTRTIWVRQADTRVFCKTNILCHIPASYTARSLLPVCVLPRKDANIAIQLILDYPISSICIGIEITSIT